MKLSTLICRARGIVPEPGTLAGTCVFCGEHSDIGHPAEFGENFTAYAALQGGEIICPECRHVLKEADYRKKMWVVSDGTFRIFSRGEAREVLQHPPDPPFVIYFTPSWKKQGWINLMNRVNLTCDQFVVGFDYDMIIVTPVQRDEYLALIADLLEKKITKSELETGELRSKSYEKIGFDLNLVNRLRMLAGDPLWKLCLFVTPSPKKEEKND